jgi:hypothetical protein
LNIVFRVSRKGSRNRRSLRSGRDDNGEVGVFIRMLGMTKGEIG